MDFTFDSLYNVQPQHRKVVGDLKYIGPTHFLHAQWYMIAIAPKSGSDGVTCQLYESRMPSRFFKLVVPAYADHSAFEISTGSGEEVGRLLVQIAKQIAEGMLVVEATHV